MGHHGTSWDHNVGNCSGPFSGPPAACKALNYVNLSSRCLANGFREAPPVKLSAWIPRSTNLSTTCDSRWACMILSAWSLHLQVGIITNPSPHSGPQAPGVVSWGAPTLGREYHHASLEQSLYEASLKLPTPNFESCLGLCCEAASQGSLEPGRVTVALCSAPLSAGRNISSSKSCT